MTDQVHGEEQQPEFTHWLSEQQEFADWLEANSRRLLNTAYRCSGDWAIAEDVAQEAAIKLFKAWPDERQRQAIIGSWGYVHVVVRNAFWSYRKVAWRRTTECDTELDADLPADAEPDYALRAALLKLPEDEAMILILCHYERYTIKEAGAELGLSPDSASRLLKKAMLHLAEILNDQEED